MSFGPHSPGKTKRLRVGVVFGSRSVEHEVSIITATQLMKHIDASRYDIVPLYVDKKGRWWTHPSLSDVRTFQNLDLLAPEETLAELQPATLSPDPTQEQPADVIILSTHGGHGEDGTMAGLFELANIPFAAPPVVAAAVAMDKVITKHVMQSAGIPVTPYVWFTREEWQSHPDHYEKSALALGLPLFVKPASLGSSVGVTRVKTASELHEALELAASFDPRLIVEAEATDCIEVNIAVMGNTMGEVSVTEQPVKSDDFLSYADKYERGGKKMKGMASLSRRIPAPISPELRDAIGEAAKTAWRVMGGRGLARIDFFADPSAETFFLGEVNAPPGSFAYYLWEKTGVSYEEVVDQLIEQALAAHAEKKRSLQSISSNILQKQ